MTQTARISAFYELGQFFLFLVDESTANDKNIEKFNLFKEKAEAYLKQAQIINPWFTKDNIYFALEQWGKALTIDNLENWLASVKLADSNIQAKNVGIVMAGNLPLVGFHDLLSVVLMGYNAYVKHSSKDKALFDLILMYLCAVDDSFATIIKQVEKVTESDAIIATGSNNTARYFEYYFKGKPSIIRKNRTSVAVLNGEESNQDLILLGDDIFRYFGLGCRNVTQLFLPRGFNMNRIFEAIFPWNFLANHSKYANNYDYNRVMYLMSNINFLDNNFFLLKEDNTLFSPIAVVNFSFYDDAEELKSTLILNEDNLQCVVSNHWFNINNKVGFGKTQQPKLHDYADGVNTLQFLAEL